jgi:hypothetical protein
VLAILNVGNRQRKTPQLVGKLLLREAKLGPPLH